MQQVLFFLFQHQTLLKNNRALQSIHETYLNVQLTKLCTLDIFPVFILTIKLYKKSVNLAVSINT